MTTPREQLRSANGATPTSPAISTPLLSRQELDFDVRRIREYFNDLKQEIMADSRITSDGDGAYWSAVVASFNRIAATALAGIEDREQCTCRKEEK